MNEQLKRILQEIIYDERLEICIPWRQVITDSGYKWV